MITVIVEVIDSLIGHQVFIVEEQTVETQTIGELQVVEDVPVILQIETELIELYTSSRIRLTIVTVGQSHDLRCAVEERSRIQDTVHPHIVGSIVAIVTSTVTHIHIVGHLVLKADTGSQLMRIHIISHIVLNVPDRIVDSVVVGKQLITQSHVVIAALRDIDEWELAGVSSTDIIEF